MDGEREGREEREREERGRREEEEEGREREVEERREGFRSTVEEREDPTEDFVTVSVRLGEGKARRKFGRAEQMTEIWNWIDCTFEKERETVTLLAGGGEEYTLEKDGERTVGDAGLEEMCGMRAVVREEEEEEEEDS